MADKLTPTQKRRLLTDIIQMSVGYDVDIFAGRPLSFYNWDGIKAIHARLMKENERD